MRKLTLISLIAILIVCVSPIKARAACSHNNYTPIYSEASHPHRYFKQCKICQDIVYTGGSATKAHGDGAWGSGTCPSCGTHTFVGQTCTNNGKSVETVLCDYGGTSHAIFIKGYLSDDICYGDPWDGSSNFAPLDYLQDSYYGIYLCDSPDKYYWDESYYGF